jgi:hypothetical protein
MEEQNGALDTLNQEGVVEPESTEESETSTDNSEELAKAKKDYESQKIRAEKAEQELKALKKAPAEVTPKNEMSPKDFLALNESKISADDLDEVMDFAKYKGITITEALKTSVLKTILKEKAEERKTAEVSNTGTSRRTSSKPSGEALLEKFEKEGIIPLEDVEATVKARLEKMKNRVQGA